MLDVPVDWVQDDLPSNYTAAKTDADLVDFRIELIRCNEVSLDGVNVGPTSFSSVYTVIVDPNGEDARPGRNFWYMFERRTDNPSVAQWFDSFGALTGNGTVEDSVAPVVPPYAMELSSKVIEGSLPVYEISGYPKDDRFQVSDRHRYYFGPRPETDSWDDDRSFLEASAGPGQVVLDASSPASRILEGQTKIAGFVTYGNALSRLLNPPQTLDKVNT